MAVAAHAALMANGTGGVPVPPGGDPSAAAPVAAAKAVFYAVVALHTAQYRTLGLRVVDRALVALCSLGRATGDYDAWLSTHGEHIFWTHGFAVFSALSAAQQMRGECAAQYFMGAILAFVLWDCGKVHTSQLWLIVCITLHHVGALVALVNQAGETPERAWRNTTIFGWLWLIHSFGWFHKWLFPKLGLPEPQEGGKYQSLDVARHLYAAVSVYFFHQYLNDECQPGLGWNYQTAALLSMLSGRLLANNNFLRVPFIRRVEAPGYAVVTAAYLLGSDNYLLAVTGYLAIVVPDLVHQWARPALKEPPPLPCDSGARELILVRRDSPSRAVFEHAAALRGLGEAPLTLSSHPGLAVVPRSSTPACYPVDGDEWLVIMLGVGVAERAVSAALDKEGFLTRRHDGRVLDVAHWKYEEGNTVSLINEKYSAARTRLAGGGRSFACNDDGTVSPTHAPWLVLGVAPPRAEGEEE